MMNGSSARFRTSVTRRCRVRIEPRITNESVYSVSGSTVTSPVSIESYMPDRIRRDDGAPVGTGTSSGLLPGACRHQVLAAVLEVLVQGADRLQRVDLVGRLVRPKRGDPREPQREPRLVAVRADDHVERDLDDDGRLDLAIAPEPGDRVLLEPARHLGDLGVGQAAVRLADVDQPVVLGGGHIIRKKNQDAAPLAVPRVI